MFFYTEMGTCYQALVVPSITQVGNMMENNDSNVKVTNALWHVGGDVSRTSP